MKPEARRFIRFAIVVGVAIALFTNLITNPGWQRGANGKVIDVERHFGWPAEFYADLWIAQEPGTESPPTIMFLLPLHAPMQFSYSDFSAIALGLNLLFDACLVVLSVLLGRCVDQNRLESWVAGVGLVAITACLFVLFSAESVSAGL